MRLFFKFTKGYRVPMILTPIFMILEVAADVASPFFMRYLIDRGVTPADMEAIWLYGGLMLALACLSFVFGFFGGRFAAIASAGFAKNLRAAQFNCIQEFDFAAINRFSAASLVNRMINDTGEIQMSFQMILRGLVRNFLMLITAIVMASFINLTLTAIFVGAGLAIMLLVTLIFFFIYPLARKLFRQYDDLNLAVKENLQGIRVIKATVREQEEKTKFQKAANAVYKTNLKVQIAGNGLIGPVINLLLHTCMLLVAWIGAKIIVNTHETDLTVGGLMILNTYTILILISVAMLSAMILMLFMSRAAYGRVKEVVLTKPTLTSPTGGLTELADSSIEFTDVSFKYSPTQELPNLVNLNLKIPAGSFVGIIGATGSGKSTLAALIPRLYDVAGGSVKVGGRDVREYDLAFLRETIAIVLQDNLLFNETIAENIRWGRQDATDEEIKAVAEIAQVDEFIARFQDGYATVVSQGGTSVSGGQRQRISIARALIKNPQILILDDATSAVDMTTERKIQAGINSYSKNLTTLLISQRVSSIKDADLIIVLDKGQIIGVGTHDELFATCAIYQEIAASQARGSQELG